MRENSSSVALLKTRICGLSWVKAECHLVLLYFEKVDIIKKKHVCLIRGWTVPLNVNREKHKVATFTELQPANVWHFLLGLIISDLYDEWIFSAARSFRSEWFNLVNCYLPIIGGFASFLSSFRRWRNTVEEAVSVNLKPHAKPLQDITLLRFLLRRGRDNDVSACSLLPCF